MKFLAKVERSIEGVVNSAFARTFKGAVQPVEISTRLIKEMDAEVRQLSPEKRLVPNEFTVGLSRSDYDHLAPHSKAMNAEIIKELRAYAQKARYKFNGTVDVHYELDDALPTGRFTVASDWVAAVAENMAPMAQTGSGRTKNPLVLEVNGVRHPLAPPGLSIGRGTEADLRINDPGISRLHARISVVSSADSMNIEIVDLGSTNGIIVNGQKVRSAQLGSGSRIEIGTTRMLVHRPSGE